MADNMEEARLFMDDYFQHRIDSGWVNTDQFYSDLFHESVSSKQWNRIKTLVDNSNGNVQSYEQTSWNINSKTSTNELSGTFVTYSFGTVNEIGTVVETIVLHKNSSYPTFKIINHHFDSPEIQATINEGIDKVTGK
jgi:hypothetical protein